MENDKDEPGHISIAHPLPEPLPALRLEEEDVLRFFDAAGSGWIREEIECSILDAEYLE